MKTSTGWRCCAVIMGLFFWAGCAEQPRVADEPEPVVQRPVQPPVPTKDNPVRSLIASHSRSLLGTWLHHGGAMSPAEMYFWDNGLLVVDSEIFSVLKEPYYFLWRRDEGRSLLTITYADDRISDDFLSRAEIHNLGESVHSIDLEHNTATYFITDNDFADNESMINFNGWIFSGKPFGDE